MVPSVGVLNDGGVTTGKVPGSTDSSVKDSVLADARLVEALPLMVGVYAVIVPLFLRLSKKVRSLGFKGVCDVTAISPPFASRMLLVKAPLIICPTNCKDTIAMTPTATQNTARMERWPPRSSERVV